MNREYLARLDWQRITLNLRRHKPLAQIARDIGCDEQTLTRLARADVREPRFTTGLRLLDAHHEHCPDQHNQLKEHHA